MKKMLFLSVLFFQAIASAECSNEVADSLTRKALFTMARRYHSKDVAIGVSIRNGPHVTTTVAIFNGKIGRDGARVDRIGSVTIDMQKCVVKNTLIGVFEPLTVPPEFLSHQVDSRL